MVYWNYSPHNRVTFHPLENPKEPLSGALFHLEIRAPAYPPLKKTLPTFLGTLGWLCCWPIPTSLFWDWPYLNFGETMDPQNVGRSRQNPVSIHFDVAKLVTFLNLECMKCRLFEFLTGIFLLKNVLISKIYPSIWVNEMIFCHSETPGKIQHLLGKTKKP